MKHISKFHVFMRSYVIQLELKKPVLHQDLNSHIPKLPMKIVPNSLTNFTRYKQK